MGELQHSSSVSSSPNIAGPLPGSARRIAQRGCGRTSLPSTHRGSCGSARRRPTCCPDHREDMQATAQHVSSRILVAVQLETAYTARKRRNGGPAPKGDASPTGRLQHKNPPRLSDPSSGGNCCQLATPERCGMPLERARTHGKNRPWFKGLAARSGGHMRH